MPPRTIDNLGIDVSTRYAQDQLQLDDQIIKEARAIPSQTEIDVAIPSFASEVDALIQLENVHHVWAVFNPPNGYLEQKGRLFSFVMIPSLGSEEKKEVQIQKILAKLDAFEEKRGKDKKKRTAQKTSNDEKEAEEDEKERKIFTSLFKTISLLDRFLIDINSRRSQYQKG